ncbi:MAG: C4-dicarboxylate ABC transporter, partial [Pseudomonadota bacterium]
MKLGKYSTARRQFLIGSALLGGAALAARPARAQGAKILRLAHLEASDSSFHKAIERMSQSVKQKTGGQVDIRVFPSGQLGGYRDIVEGLRLG